MLDKVQTHAVVKHKNNVSIDPTSLNIKIFGVSEEVLKTEYPLSNEIPKK